ncbi:MAG: TadE/TadG family type IV pilus assembly protein [Actinomycetota bacterium]
MELAIVLPLIAIAMLAIVQVSLLVWDELRILHGAREGARVLSITNDPSKASDAVLSAAALDKNRTTITIEPSNRPAGSSASVSISYKAPVVVPFMDQFTGPFTLTTTIQMRMERDPP